VVAKGISNEPPPPPEHMYVAFI